MMHQYKEEGSRAHGETGTLQAHIACQLLQPGHQEILDTGTGQHGRLAHHQLQGVPLQGTLLLLSPLHLHPCPGPLLCGWIHSLLLLLLLPIPLPQHESHLFLLLHRRRLLVPPPFTPIHRPVAPLLWQLRPLCPPPSRTGWRGRCVGDWDCCGWHRCCHTQKGQHRLHNLVQAMYVGLRNNIRHKGPTLSGVQAHSSRRSRSTHTHTHTHTLPHMNTYIHAYLHAYMWRHGYTHSGTHTHRHMRCVITVTGGAMKMATSTPAHQAEKGP